jgi:hypothetical protein
VNESIQPASADDRPESNLKSKEAPAPPSEGSSFRLRRVMLAVAPLALVAVAAAAMYAFGGADWIAEMMRPPLAPVEGQVFYQGQPLANAIVQTKPLRAALRGAIASSDEEGKFQLRTDIDGTYRRGAYVGEHQIVVAAYGEPPNAPGGAPLATPARYASYETTPLRIEVAAAPGENLVRFDLEGDPPAPPRRRAAPDADQPESASEASEGDLESPAPTEANPAPSSSGLRPASPETVSEAPQK